jgi:hypothetical protein
LVGLLAVGCRSESPSTESAVPAEGLSRAVAPHPEQALIEGLVLSSRMLARPELNVMGAQGHVSVRSQENPNHYYIARHVSAGIVGISDIIENDLDSNPVVLGVNLDALFPGEVLYAGLFNLFLGNSMMVVVNAFGVVRRRNYGLALFALANPFYWLLHSVASYKALWQLITKPFYWEKTNHGISKQMHAAKIYQFPAPEAVAVEGESQERAA